MKQPQIGWDYYSLPQLFSLISDYKRTNSYAEFLLSGVCEGKTVVDCGAGSGICTWLALKGGAERVIALDIADHICAYLNIVFVNEPRVSVVKCNLIKDEIPEGDLYIHEMVANGLLGEGITDIFDNLRSQNITEVYPTHASVSTASISHGQIHPSENLDHLLVPEAQEFIKYNTQYMPSHYLLSTVDDYSVQDQKLRWHLDLRDPIPQRVKDTVYSGALVWRVGFDAALCNSYTNANDVNNNWNVKMPYSTFAARCNLESGALPNKV